MDSVLMRSSFVQNYKQFQLALRVQATNSRKWKLYFQCKYRCACSLDRNNDPVKARYVYKFKMFSNMIQLVRFKSPSAVFDVGPTLYKCYTKMFFCLLGCSIMCFILPWSCFRHGNLVTYLIQGRVIFTVNFNPRTFSAQLQRIQKKSVVVLPLMLI